MKFKCIKFLFYGVIFSSMMFALAGCSSEVQNSKLTKLNNNNPTVLKIWGGVPEEAGPQEMIDLWNSQNPDVQVEYVMYSNDDNGNLRLDTALLNEKEVDLFLNYFSSNYRQRVKMGVAENLSEMDIFDIEEKMGPDSKEWKVEGAYYAVPTKKNLYFVLLNKDALDEVGLEVPKDWTWTELKDYAKKLTNHNRWGFLQYDFVLPYPMDGTLGEDGYVKSDGTSNFDHVVVVNYLELLHNMMYVDKSTPPLVEQLTKKMPIDMLFLGGEAAMLFGGEWLLRYINNSKENHFPDFKVAFAPIPKISHFQTDFRYIGGVGDAISINSHSEHKQEAVEFIKWYVDEGMNAMAAGGRLPASKNANMQEALSLLMGNHNRYDKDSLEYVFHGDLETIQMPLDQAVVDLRKEELEKYFLGKTTIEETIDNLVRRHNEFLSVDK